MTGDGGASRLVSVVVPVFNGERFLADALRSATAQTYAPTEIIVVDDGSTDGTAAIVRAFPDVVALWQSHASVASARNTGVRAARGEFLAFLDADDVLPPGKLATQIDYLCTHPEVDCVFGQQEVFSDMGVDRAWMGDAPEWLRWLPDWEQRVQVQPMSMVVRRPVFEAVGFFDERLRIGDDDDWIWRAIEMGVTMNILDNVVLHRRAHDLNISRDLDTRSREYLMLLKGHIDRTRAAGCE